MSVREYVGARYVPIIVGEWDNTRTYEPLMVVTYQGNSYTSRQYVPAGIEITNESYWVLSANYNAQVEQYRKEVKSYDDRITTAQNDATSALSLARTNESNIAANNAELAGTADSGLKTLIDNAEQALRNEIKSNNLASLLGFSSNPSDASNNTNLFNTLENVKILSDIDIWFDAPIVFHKDKYITGSGTLHYIGQATEDYFITMLPTKIEGNSRFYGQSLNVTIDCNATINGFRWYGGTHTDVQLTCINPYKEGCVFEKYTSSDYPSYGNTYSVLVHKKDYVPNLKGVEINTSDDYFNFVEVGNFTQGIIINANNVNFGYVHCWIASDSLFTQSTAISASANYTSGSISIDTLFCDSMQYAIQIYTNLIVNIGHLFNFWNEANSSMFNGADRPFLIKHSCRLKISSLDWLYKSGTFNSETGESNCNIKLNENDVYAAIGNMTGITFIGDVKYSPACRFNLIDDSNYQLKYKSLPKNYVVGTSSTIEVNDFESQLQNKTFVTHPRRYTICSNNDSKLFFAQRNAGNELTWFAITGTQVV